MAEQDPGHALLSALHALAAAANVTTLRRVLHQLVDENGIHDEPVPDTKTPPVHVAADGAQSGTTNGRKITRAQRTTRRASTPHPTRSTSTAANGQRMSPAAWLALRARVNRKMLDDGLDLAGLAAATGYAAPTVRGAMLKRTAPISMTLTARLRAFLAAGMAADRPTGANGAASLPDPPAAVPGPGNGHAKAAAGAEAVKTLAARLRAKRRPIPMTSTSLAETIGCTADELDAAIAGKAVSAAAAERLAAWAAG